MRRTPVLRWSGIREPASILRSCKWAVPQGFQRREGLPSYRYMLPCGAIWLYGTEVAVPEPVSKAYLLPWLALRLIRSRLCTILQLHRKGGGRMTSSDSGSRCTKRPGEVAET